jgi:hypothetical protein
MVNQMLICANRRVLKGLRAQGRYAFGTVFTASTLTGSSLGPVGLGAAGVVASVVATSAPGCPCNLATRLQPLTGWQRPAFCGFGLQPETRKSPSSLLTNRAAPTRIPAPGRKYLAPFDRRGNGATRPFRGRWWPRRRRPGKGAAGSVGAPDGARRPAGRGERSAGPPAGPGVCGPAARAAAVAVAADLLG